MASAPWAEGTEAIMFRTTGGGPSTWEPLIPAEVLRLPEDLARVDALLDDSVFFAPFAAYFHLVLARLPTPAECYLRLMSLKFRHQLGDESSCAEVSELAVASYVYPAGRFPAGR
jgi:transposase, IS5 family